MKIENILCDRDGTLIIDKHYLHLPEEVELLPTVKEGIALLHSNHRFLALISNQSGVGRGYFTEEDVRACNSSMLSLLCQEENPFRELLFCPHAPEEDCQCRKPRTGLWDILRCTYNLKAEETTMIGDKQEDMLFAVYSYFPYAFLIYSGKGKAIIDKLGCTELEKGCIDITKIFSTTYNIDTKYTQIYAGYSFIDIASHILHINS